MTGHEERRQGRGTFATLSVDGRAWPGRPLRGSGIGSASGLAVVAATERDVLDAARWMPGRVLILCNEAITPSSIPIVVNSARLATFVGLVVVIRDVVDLGHLGEEGVPIPVVVVQREADHSWLHRAVRVSLGVHLHTEDEVDIRTPVHERRRRAAAPALLGPPGTVRH